MKNEDPEFVVVDCPCEKPNCTSILFAMIRPVIKPIEGRDELAACVHFPLELAQEFIDMLKEKARAKGFKVR